MSKSTTKTIMRQLFDEGCSAVEAAAWLNKRGYVSKQKKPWKAGNVAIYRLRYGMRSRKRREEVKPRKRESKSKDFVSLLEDVLTSNLSHNAKAEVIHALVGGGK